MKIKNVEEDDGDDNSCSYGWLEEIERPKESDMVGITYQGPQIITNAYS